MIDKILGKSEIFKLDVPLKDQLKTINALIEESKKREKFKESDFSRANYDDNDDFYSKEELEKSNLEQHHMLFDEKVNVNWVYYVFVLDTPINFFLERKFSVL